MIYRCISLSRTNSVVVESGPSGVCGMTRRCSHCSNNGHNSRTCPNRGGGGGGVKLFGVRLTDGSIIKKSASMGNLSAHYHQDSPPPSSDPVHVSDGYLSDDPAPASNRRADRKKGYSFLLFFASKFFIFLFFKLIFGGFFGTGLL